MTSQSAGVPFWGGRGDAILGDYKENVQKEF